jgi:hypothetical protein
MALSMGPLMPTGTGDIANESSHSAVSWAAIFAGTFVALSITLVLAALGAGIGLTSVSPWPNSGASATTFSIMTGIGLIVVQWLSSGIGGFITGRLRTKWVGVHNHEVFFRDTAHGFLTWSLATVVGMALVASATSSIVGSGTHAAATVAGGALQIGAQAAVQGAPGVSGYDVDALFRSDKPDVTTGPEQAARILANGVHTGDVPPADRAYLAQLVSGRTGISQGDAQKRVDDAIERAKDMALGAKQAADVARKAAAQLSIFTALSMMIGAFIACVAAAYGGTYRDEH